MSKVVRQWQVTVLDELGKRCLWGTYKSRAKAREAAKVARDNSYPTRIRSAWRRKVKASKRSEAKWFTKNSTSMPTK